jgi:1-acyl-sn-glycerol-3-phosphate acyltransferase
MVRTLFVWLCISLGGIFFSCLVLITYPFDRTGRLGHRLGGLWGKVALLANRVKVRVEGAEHVSGTGPYIFMSNHLGSYDIFSLQGCLPFHFKWLAKKEIFSIPLLGWAMRAAGYVSIDREGTRETVEAMNEAARKIHDGMNVMIFPEGSRSPDGSIQPFKKGGFTLAIKSGVPIVPVALTGSREIMPKETRRISSGAITIRMDRPIETKDLSLKDRKALMEQVHDAISRNFRIIAQPRETDRP